VTSLVGAGRIKERLADTHIHQLSHLTPGNLPDDIRGKFESICVYLMKEKDNSGKATVEATI
jgi:hypothetical protein